MTQLPMLPSFLSLPPMQEGTSPPQGGGGVSFLEKAVAGLSTFLKEAYTQWDFSSRDGLLQRMDPRVKVALLLTTITVVSLKHQFWIQISVSGLLFTLSWFSKMGIWDYYRRILLFTWVFGVLVPLPSCLNILVDGEVILPLLNLGSSKRFLWVQVPHVVGITKEGAFGLGLVAVRVMNSIAITFLVFRTTPFTEIMSSLKSLRIPDPLIMTVTLTYRYLFIVVSIVEQLHRARSARLIRGENSKETRRWAAHRMAFLFQRAQDRCEQIRRAMEARGLSGKIELVGLGPIKKKDRVWIGTLWTAAAVLALF